MGGEICRLNITGLELLINEEKSWENRLESSNLLHRCCFSSGNVLGRITLKAIKVFEFEIAVKNKRWMNGNNTETLFIYLIVRSTILLQRKHSTAIY